ncbi:MAG TPA: glycosyltransferase family 1 protein [Nitrospira sp.]|nr:glycosyltransferase family 1 protein [Nitrospira sp.]
MRIGFDATPIAEDRGGVGWHVYYLLRSLLALKQDLEIVAYLRPGTTPPGEMRAWTGGERLRWVESSKWAMRWRGTADRLDLYHGPNFRVHTTGRYGSVVTIHDLWLERFPQYSPKLLGQWLSSQKTKRTARDARKVITVSEFSAGELTELYGIPRRQIAVIHNGVAEDFRPYRDDGAMAALRQRIGLTQERYILFIGGADPRKNHRVFLEAASLVRTSLQGKTLLLVGSTSHPFGSYEATAKSFGLEGQVLCPGRLPMEDLRLLYSYTDLFVFPSLYEGFGMPVLEAMACGAPVITSRTTALGEVAGDAALLIDPTDAQELSKTMEVVLENESVRSSLTAKGFERVRKFSWEQAARQTLAVYKDVCGA